MPTFANDDAIVEATPDDAELPTVSADCSKDDGAPAPATDAAACAVEPVPSAVCSSVGAAAFEVSDASVVD